MKREASRPRPQKLEATVFIFESVKKPFTTHAVYLDQASFYSGNPKWHHTATIDPAIWIEHLLNNPKARTAQIEGLCYKPQNES